MARVFYSMAGEGRGHATRVRVVVERLRARHDLVLYASGAAFEMLAEAYAGTDVGVRRIPGLFFHYKNQRLSFYRTTREAARYAWGFPKLVRRLERDVRAERPDLVVTDFEPALPSAAQRCDVPYVSLDHQHFLVVNDLSCLPWPLRTKAQMMAPIVWSYYHRQEATIVSSFYFPPLRRGYQNVVQAGVLLRDEVLQAGAEAGKHLLVYLRRFAGANVLEALKASGREVRIYGLGERPRDGNLSFHPVSEHGFLADLASCEALISNAGNQLVGEAMYLHKPVFVMPEANNFEQKINAHFLRASGGGDWVEPEDFDTAHLQSFLSRLDGFRSRIVPERLNGNDVATAALEAHLPEAVRLAPRPAGVSSLPETEGVAP